jgi:hypothetical protein
MIGDIIEIERAKHSMRETGNVRKSSVGIADSRTSDHPNMTNVPAGEDGTLRWFNLILKVIRSRFELTTW